MKPKIITKNIIEIWKHIEKKEKFHLKWLFVLMVFTSITEIISIGSVFPFIMALTDINNLNNVKPIAFIFNFFDLNDDLSKIIFLASTFIILIFFSNLTKLLLLWINTRVAFKIGVKLSSKLFLKILQQPYSSHINRNSSDFLDSISNKSNRIVTLSVLPIINISGNIIILLGIILIVLFLTSMLGVLVISFLVLTYFLIAFLTNRIIKEQGKIVFEESSRVTKTIQETLLGIKQIIIDNLIKKHWKNHLRYDLKLRRALGNTIIVSQFPRPIIETFIITLVVLAASYIYYKNQTINDFIPILGAFILSAQRAIPLIHQVYTGFILHFSNSKTIDEIILLLNLEAQKTHNKKAIFFKDTIYLSNISFRYSKNSKWILKDLDLKILKGSKVGFIGSSGSGKSTILDILCGLYFPEIGSLYVDKTKVNEGNVLNWYKKIAYVPQNPHLINGSICENVTLKDHLNSKEMEKAIDCLKKVQFFDEVSQMNDGIFSQIGERGKKLSGGQAQRLVIARALYKNVDILIFDEATSALDTETEARLMSSIKKLWSELTVIKVAHRINTLKDCDIIYRISKNGFCKKIK